MPAKSKSQQRLFGMALAVRKGEMKRSDVWKEVLDIVDSDMTDKEIEDFAKTKHDGLKEHYTMKSLYEYINESSKTLMPSDDPIKNDIYNYLKQFKIVWGVNDVDSALEDITKERYLKNYLDDSDLKGAEKVYWMKCWNGGDALSKSSLYTLTMKQPSVFTSSGSVIIATEMLLL